MTITYNEIIGINEDAQWKDIVEAFEQKIEALVEKMSTHDNPGVNPNEDPLIMQWFAETIQLTIGIRKILTNRINNAIDLLSKKADSLLTALYENGSDPLFLNKKINKRENINTFKTKLENIKEKLNSQDEKEQIDYGRACDEIQAAALNARSGIADHTGQFFKLINKILDILGISFKIQTDTENQIDSAEKAIYKNSGQ